MSISTRNQCQVVLKHLIDHGYITQLIASNYGIRRLASRMSSLKQQGLQFESQPRRDDQGVKYAYYTMTLAERDREAFRLARGLSFAIGKRLAA